jgi:hypothetical protein
MPGEQQRSLFKVARGISCVMSASAVLSSATSSWPRMMITHECDQQFQIAALLAAAATL